MQLAAAAVRRGRHLDPHRLRVQAPHVDERPLAHFVRQQPHLLRHGHDGEERLFREARRIAGEADRGAALLLALQVEPAPEPVDEGAARFVGHHQERLDLHPGKRPARHPALEGDVFQVGSPPREDATLSTKHPRLPGGQKRRVFGSVERGALHLVELDPRAPLHQHVHAGECPARDQRRLEERRFVGLQRLERTPGAVLRRAAEADGAAFRMQAAGDLLDHRAAVGQEAEEAARVVRRLGAAGLPVVQAGRALLRDLEVRLGEVHRDRGGWGTAGGNVRI